MTKPVKFFKNLIHKQSNIALAEKLQRNEYRNESLAYILTLVEGK